LPGEDLFLQYTEASTKTTRDASFTQNMPGCRIPCKVSRKNSLIIRKMSEQFKCLTTEWKGEP